MIPSKYHAGLLAVATGVALGLGGHARADEARLPTNGMVCLPIALCSGSSVQLEGVGGVQGIRIAAGQGFKGTGFYAISFSVNGPVEGLNIPPGTAIPYHFTFDLNASNEMGNMIAGSSFYPESSGGSLEAGPTVLVYERSGFHTYVARGVKGEGTLRFPDGYRAGSTPLHLSARVALQVSGGDLIFQSNISWSATLTFDSVHVDPIQFPLTLKRDDNKVVLQWPVTPMGNYRVESTADLSEWTAAVGELQFAADQATWTGLASPGAAFYRVVQGLP